MFLLWVYSIYQYGRASWGFGGRYTVLGTLSHTLVWLGLAFYIVWTCSAIPLASNTDVYNRTSDTNGMWTNMILHGITIFALTSAAVGSSYDRVPGLYYNIISCLHSFHYAFRILLLMMDSCAEKAEQNVLTFCIFTGI
jgi:hypothetical protein